MKKNILLLSEFFPDLNKLDITGGVESRAYFLAKNLSIDNNVFVISSRRKRQKKIQKKDNITIIRIGAEYNYTNYGSLKYRILFGMSLFFKISKIVKKYSINYVDDMSFFTYPAIFAPFKARKFITYHEIFLGQWVKNTGTNLGIFGEIAERKILFFLKFSKVKVISVSEFTYKKLKKRGIKNITIVNNGINVDKYLGKPLKKFTRPTICVISRLISQKRVGDILYAVSLIKKKIPNIIVKIIGQGEERKKLTALAKKLKVEKNVEFLGYVKDHSVVIKTLKKSHLFAHASIREGFGIVLLEAAACGVPYVASNIEPFIEVTANGLGGKLFKQKNYYEMAEMINQLFKNKKEYDKKVRQCSKLVKMYDWKNISNRIIDVYSGKVID